MLARDHTVLPATRAFIRGKMQNIKLQDIKLTNRSTREENAEPENYRPV